MSHNCYLGKRRLLAKGLLCGKNSRNSGGVRHPVSNPQVQVCTVPATMTCRALMSDQSSADQRIHRLSRVYAAASRINSLIVRSQDIQTLFSEVCRAAVVEGGLRMAWVGRVGDDGQALLPVARV